MGAAAVAVIHRREREVVDAFRRGRALSPETARDLDDLGVNPDSLGFHRLHRRAVVREAAPGAYYLDEEVWTAVRGTRRRVAFAVLLVAILAAILLVTTGGIEHGVAR
ncbi:MAG TPA: hypothetical protein VFJ74_03850 [Gemmatimonadaceae bacterium]|nr:hypothetical protein [Gemmatimonadaceae bacterium]